jgi:hypothetical protein
MVTRLIKLLLPQLELAKMTPRDTYIPQPLAANSLRPTCHETLTQPSTWAKRLMQIDDLSSPCGEHSIALAPG